MLPDLPPVPYRSAVGSLFGNSVIPDASIRPGAANAGLVFDRYLRIWEGEIDNPNKTKRTNEVLQEFVRAFNARSSQPDHPAVKLLRSFHDRLDRSEAQSVSSRVKYRVDWRLTSGLGSDHPLENGFCFDTLIGIPVIHGTAVKGLCRAAAELEDLPTDVQRELFGSAEEKEESAVEPASGGLLFFDAYPVIWPRLKVDVVNCHHPAYYGAALDMVTSQRPGKPARKTPRVQAVEYENPVPVYFLTVDAGTEFTFRIRGRAGNTHAVHTAMRLLDFGLTVLGIGAKTAVGYGVMQRLPGAAL